MSATLVACAVLVLTGCGPRNIGGAVVLWSPDESTLESGSAVTVRSESELNETYEITTEELDEPIEIARWRVEFFEEQEDARARAADYAAAFDGNATLYAHATRNALPIREEANPSARAVYRLREGEEVKLIDRQPEQTDLGGLVSHWYEALTQTGERGWVFGYTLDIFDPTDSSLVVETGGSDDPMIDLLLQNVWRPIYFVDMISNGAIDLELFRSEYGLFPDPENNQLELVLPSHATIFEYEEIARVGQRRYLAEGTSLQLTFQRNDELSIQYRYDDVQYVLALQRVPGKVDEYVETERERRSVVYEELMSRGPAFASDNYGELSFLEDQRFSWTGYERLVPAVVPEGATTTGRIDLGLFLTASLLQEYDGAISFYFDGLAKPVRFAYTFRQNGVRFAWIREEDVDDRLVTRISTSPLTIFMSSTGG